jgi:hypothetical protein
MKKHKMVVDLLAVDDVCIEASKARARLLESWGKGTSMKKEDNEVNTADRGNHKDRGDRAYHGKQSSSRRRRCLFGVLMMRRSCARFTAPRDMICKSARLFWIERR